MTRTRARNVGAVALGTVLLGLGCTQRNEADRTSGRAFPHEETRDPVVSSRKAGYPEPEFGPLARRTIERGGGSRQPGFGPLHHPLKSQDERETRKGRLLSTASDGTLATANRPASPGAPGATKPVNPRVNPSQTARSSPPEITFAKASQGIHEEAVAVADQNLAVNLPEEAAPVAWPDVDFAPDPPEVALAVGEDKPEGADTLPAVDEALATLASPEGQQEGGQVPSIAASREAEPDMPHASGSRLAVAPGDGIASDSGNRTQTSPVAGPQADESNAREAGGPTAIPQLARAAGESGAVRQRSIAGRSASEADTSDIPRAAPLERIAAPGLAAIVPSARVPIPMTSVVVPQPEPQLPAPANDAGDTASVSGLVPVARSGSTLGLDKAGSTAGIEPASLADNRQSAFTASAEPPVLSYQDELILEVKVKGIDATDTVIAYGTRAGVYLPLGTLARILDIAITVSDDGHYASGWVLDEARTLTIDLRQRLLTLQSAEIALSSDFAVAFEGELYVRAERFGEFMPLRVETDLRSQAIVIETLQPFPFEERMKRDAERERLAARSRAGGQVEWPRQETPYRIASLPVADVELRAVSDSAFGPRLESDVQLAGDLGFLTAQAFVSGDTDKGLTASLIELGRMDPDAQLLGPLQATAFALGDVSTVSMPLGLRSVTGRGAVVTNASPETVSVFERIDLRGILQEGYEVELYRNDILVGSTRESVNGQYQFLQVPVDFGLNVFRLVFFGPQGQRSEQVRRIAVGDGRLPQGKLVYRFGAVQKDENVLGVRDPDFIPATDFGTWRASAELAYGLSSDITTVLSGAWFETPLDTRWLATAGIRTGVGRFALKGDVAVASEGAFAASGGVGGRFGNSAVTLSHVEYSGNFIDETRSLGAEFLRRSTEIDFNTSLDFGNPVTGFSVPLTARLRHIENADGRTQTNGALRASTRLPGFIVSNTLEYSRNSSPQFDTLSQVFGNFDLATATRSRTRGRLSLGYRVHPDPDFVSASLEIDHALDADTAIRGSVGYAFQTKSTQIGLSAVRDFKRFTLALDGSYAFRNRDYAVGLRLGFSFGRDPLRGRLFVSRPGLARSGGATLRAFRDMDGDGVFGPGDSVLPAVDFAAFNQTATTGDDGIARLTGLGEGRGVGIQLDTSTLPDIDLAPAQQGIEIVPRPGRIHSADFPVVAMSEIDGTVTFRQEGRERGVSGVRLQLRDTSGKVVAYARTEIEGYYFFEQVMPGSYTVELEPDQAQRLNLCADRPHGLAVGYEADLISRDIDIALCD